MNKGIPLTYLAQVKRTRKTCACIVLIPPLYLLTISMIKPMALFRGVVMTGTAHAAVYNAQKRNMEGLLRGVESFQLQTNYGSLPSHAKDVK